MKYSIVEDAAMTTSISHNFDDVENFINKLCELKEKFVKDITKKSIIRDNRKCDIVLDDKYVGRMHVGLPTHCYPKVVPTIIVDDYSGLKPIAKALSAHFSMDAFYPHVWD